MNTSRRYAPEVRQRAVRMIFDHEADYPLPVGGHRRHCPQGRLHTGDAA